MHILRRPARWLRRTRYLLAQTRADLGLGLSTSPAWLRDNPFLMKADRTETRRLGLLLRLGAAVLLLSCLLIGGLWLARAYPGPASGVPRSVFGLTFPAALFIVLTFVHITLIGSARTALTVSLADEARRGTLADLLLTPLRRAEMLLAMGVAPARSALIVAVAGLPVYLLLGEIGALTARDIACLYLMFALLSYGPPLYALPALAGGAMTPETALGRFGMSRARRPVRPGGSGLAGAYPLFLLFLVAPIMGLLSGGWLVHLLGALHLHFNPSTSFLLFLAWPYYALQVLSARLDFFHASLSPLVYGLPLLVCRWVASALQTAAALSAGDGDDMARLPLATRARTLARWTARAAGLCALGVVWRAWVESGDTAALVGGTSAALGGAPGWDAAGLLLLLGGLSLPGACHRALAASSRRKDGGLRPPVLALRRSIRRAMRPLCVAGVTFLLACVLGGLSPFAAPVYQTAGRIALAGAVSTLWAVGLRRLVPAKSVISGGSLLYILPLVALSTPVPGFRLLAALSPATTWLRLFPDASALLGRFPLFHIAPPPSWEVCLLGPALVGALGLMATVSREGLETRRVGDLFLTPSPPASGGVARSAGAGSPRHAARTAALLAWITARTDNPLLTYEMRTRTRSGRWLDWLVLAPFVLLAASTLGVAYPEFVAAMAGMSPFHFFGSDGFLTLSSRLGDGNMVWPNLAALLLTGQCYALGFRGQVIGEGLIARDRQRGIWGFLLLTPLTAREIFWGKVWGQTAAVGAAWAGCGLAALGLYGLSVPAVGVAPALVAWLVGQAFVAALFVLGLAVGAALSTYPVFSKSLHGLSGLVFVAIVGLGLWGQFQLIPFDQAPTFPAAWSLLPSRLLLGIGYALALATPLLLFAQWRVADVRRRDVAVGDGVE